MEILLLPRIRITIQQIISFFIVFWMGVLLFAGCTSDRADPSETTTDASDQTYQSVGVVKTITPTKNYINIDHEAIPGFMGAMAMFFSVSDTSVLQNVAVDDSIAFTIEVKAGKPGIVAIDVME